jgi:hypothetical protein
LGFDSDPHLKAIEFPAPRLTLLNTPAPPHAAHQLDAILKLNQSDPIEWGNNHFIFRRGICPAPDISNTTGSRMILCACHCVCWVETAPIKTPFHRDQTSSSPFRETRPRLRLMFQI